MSWRKSVRAGVELFFIKYIRVSRFFEATIVDTVGRNFYPLTLSSFYVVGILTCHPPATLLRRATAPTGGETVPHVRVIQFLFRLRTNHNMRALQSILAADMRHLRLLPFEAVPAALECRIRNMNLQRVVGMPV